MTIVLVIIIVNLLFFGAVAYYFVGLKKELREEKKAEFEERKFNEGRIEQAENQLEEELAEARNKANMILSESEKIARDLIIELEESLGMTRSRQDINLPEGTNFELELGNLSSKIKTQYLSKIHNLLTSLEKYQVNQAQKVQEFAQTQEETTDKNIQAIRIDELSKMHDRIERYKLEEIALFDEKVKLVIDTAALEVLGHALTEQEHQELISKALSKAREENAL